MQNTLTRYLVHSKHSYMVAQKLRPPLKPLRKTHEMRVCFLGPGCHRLYPEGQKPTVERHKSHPSEKMARRSPALKVSHRQTGRFAHGRLQQVPDGTPTPLES